MTSVEWLHSQEQRKKFLFELKRNAKMIHFFGLGFIQIKMSDDSRYHVYHPNLESIMPEEEIHNHRYDFRSHVMKGSIKQDIYKVTWMEASHELWKETCEQGSTPEFNGLVGCDHLLSVIIPEGGQYAIDHNTYHRITASRAMTLIKRGPHKKNRASVVRPKGTQAVCPFSKQVPEKELWECVEDILLN